MEWLLYMYCGFGVGMCAKLLTDYRILCRGFFTSTKEFKELTQPQYILFVFLFCSLWPFRFEHRVRSAFKIKDKETGNVLPM